MRKNADRLDMATAWCILRTSPGRTLPLAQSLATAGLDAWSPQRMQDRRRGASRARYAVEVPIMPTFVFVPARHLHQLRRILSLPSNPHPSFSIFHYRDAIPLIADNELATIRLFEERERLVVRKQQRHLFAVGSPVRSDQSAFVGLTGVIESCDGRFAMVDFGGSRSVKVGAWLLRTDEVRAA